MRVYDITVFLICLNLGFVTVGTLGMWADIPEGVTVSPEVVIPENMDIPGTGLMGGATISLGLILLAIVIGGMAGLTFKITTPQVVGIVSFAIIFNVLLGLTVGILSSIYVPAAIIAALILIHEFTLVAAVVQMATGTSLKVTE